MEKQFADSVILEAISCHNGMDINDIYYELSDKDGFTERVIKESVQRLRRNNLIEPNHLWKMIAK